MTRETCVYCGKTLNTRSKEHIIPDSIGGQYKSVDICCNECNGVLSKKNDAKFAKIFNPIISRIDSFPRTYRKKTELSCKGVVEYEGEKVPVRIDFVVPKIDIEDTLQFAEDFAEEYANDQEQKRLAKEEKQRAKEKKIARDKKLREEKRLAKENAKKEA